MNIGYFQYSHGRRRRGIGFEDDTDCFDKQIINKHNKNII